MDEIDRKIELYALQLSGLKPLFDRAEEEYFNSQAVKIYDLVKQVIKSNMAKEYWLQTFPESEQVKALKLELFKFSEMGLQLIRENKKLKEQLNGNS